MKIAIIGGGITGLTTALALHKVGFSSVVYEKSDEMKEVGAGIWIQPNAIKVFDWLGLKNQIIQGGVELDKIEITKANFDPIKRMKSEVIRDEMGNQTVAIHRGRLQAILIDAVKKNGSIELGKKYVAHKQIGTQTEVQFADETIKVDALLGADGIHSSVRKAMFPDAKIRDTGQVCWRGIAKMVLPDELQQAGKEAWGNNIRFGFSHVSSELVYWFAVVNESVADKIGKQTNKEFLLNLFKDFNKSASYMIDQTEHHAIHKGSLSDLKRLPHWHDAHCCLLGDAGHATTPNMGQGACQGIEDAYYISQSFLKSDERSVVFESFEKQRRKKVDYIVNTSWTFGKAAHHPFSRALMKIIMKLTPEKLMSDQMNKVYAVDITNES